MTFPTHLLTEESAWKRKRDWPRDSAGEVPVFLLLNLDPRGENLETVIEGVGRRTKKGVRFQDEFGDCTCHVQAWRPIECELEDVA